MMDVLFSLEVLVVASTVSLVMSVVPFVVLVAFRPTARALYWLVAAGFATSLVPGDTLQRIDVAMDLSEGRWLNTYVWPPVQFAVFARAVLDSTVLWWAVVAVLTAIAWLQLQGPVDSPEVIATLVGGAFVVAAVLTGDSGPLDRAILAYCGIGSVLFVLYGLTYESYRVSTGWWYGYQVVRATAIALFVRVAWQERSHA